MATAVTMIKPVTISCTQLGRPRLTAPIRITVMSSAPSTEPVMDPRPPITIMMMISIDFKKVKEFVCTYMR